MGYGSGSNFRKYVKVPNESFESIFVSCPDNISNKLEDEIGDMTDDELKILAEVMVENMIETYAELFYKDLKKIQTRGKKND